MKASCRRVSVMVSASNSWKIIEKGEAAKSDAYHIERSGAHLGLQIGLRLVQVAAGVWVFAALISRTPLHVGPLVPTCKIGTSP